VKHAGLLAVITVVVASAMGCGSGDESGDSSGGDETSAEAWADDVCSSVSTWDDVVTEAASTLSDPKDVSVNGFKDALGSVVDATSALVTEVSGLGPPDTEAGDEAAALLTTLSEDLEAEADVLSEAMDADPDSVSELLASSSIITEALAAMRSDVEAAVNEIDELDGGAELEDAFATAESCQQVSSAG